jgi:hypothetical protein
MLRYWHYVHSAGRLPGLSDFILDDVPGLRPNIRLIDVVSGGALKYRVRAIGREHLKHLGYDPSGGWYENVAPHFSNSIVELDLARVCRDRRPIYRRGKSIVSYVSGVRGIERVHLPLSSDGNSVDGIATLTLFFPSLRPNARSRDASKRMITPDDAMLLSPLLTPTGLVFPIAGIHPPLTVPVHVS